jgi:glycine dehydrogenase subunit 1
MNTIALTESPLRSSKKVGSLSLIIPDFERTTPPRVVKVSMSLQGVFCRLCFVYTGFITIEGIRLTMTGFIPHSSDERQAMLNAIGVRSIDDLFDDIAPALRGNLDPKTLQEAGKDELTLIQDLRHAASQNAGAEMASFMGGGAYHRFIPPAVNALAFRSEFYTAYTPYQPEISQGTLQAIYEFQSMMSQLTGMDVTNASVYDGANAVCEAALMASRVTKRDTVAVATSINPHTKRALETYASANHAITLLWVDVDAPLLPQLEPHKTMLAAVIVQNPDYTGCVRHLEHVAPLCHDLKALFVLVVDAFNLVLMPTPASLDADIVCGDIQAFGNPVNYGGPYGGFLSTKTAYIRQLPGRLVGKTTDNRGQEAYTLTLQTREQHIRRSKATSNICTNQALNVLKATIYLSLVGAQGLRDMALVSAERAHQLLMALLHIPGVTLRYPEHPFLNEFALSLPIPAEQMIQTMARLHNVLPGIDMGRHDPSESHSLLVAVTEMNTPTQIKHYVAAFKESLTQSTADNVTPITTVSSNRGMAMAEMPIAFEEGAL